MIAQERAEVQNMVVVRYWTISKLDRLYDMAELEAEDSHDEKRKSIEGSPVENRQLTLEAPPPDYNSASKALIKLPIISFYELDASMNAIRESPKEMLRVSGEVIDPLLNRWTRLPDLQEQAKRGYFPHSNSQDGNYTAYASHAYEYYETDEEDSPPSPVDTREKGYYLEGTTTDWRKPHSTDARRERSRLRREYSTFQPSIDSDVSDHDEVKPPKKARAPTRHIIDSDDESEPDRDHQKPRRSSDGSRLEKPKSKDSNRDRNRPRSYTPGSDTRAYSDKYPVSPRGSISSPFTGARAQSQSQQGGRPMPTPGQMPNFHHSISSPLPPIHGRPGQRPSPNGTPYGSPYATYNGLNPIPAPPPYSSNYRGQHAPGLLQPQSLPQGMSPQQMHAQLQQQQQLQQYRQPPPLTMSRAADIPHMRPSSRHSTSSKSPRESREVQEARERKMKEERKKEFKKGATKGILGGVGIATFLEALEGLSI
jgi:hypothetical protein